MNKKVIVVLVIILAMVIYWNRSRTFPSVSEGPLNVSDEDEEGNGSDLNDLSVLTQMLSCAPLDAQSIQMAVVSASDEICLDGECNTLNRYQFVLQGVPLGSTIKAITGPVTTSSQLFVMGYSGEVYFGGNMGTQMLLPGGMAVGDALTWFGGNPQPPNTSNDFAVIVPNGSPVSENNNLFRISIIGGTLNTAAVGVMIKPPQGGPESHYFVNFNMEDLTEGGIYQSNIYPTCQ